MEEKKQYAQVTAEDDEEEALSLNNYFLPSKDFHGSITTAIQTPEEDFDFFCSLSQNPDDMCSADELFFQGQILPIQQYSKANSQKSSGSEYGNGGSLSSSSTNSSNSSTNKKMATPRNPFYSHPSPSPRMFIKRAQDYRNSNHNSKSSAWNIFRQGLVTTPPGITAVNGLRTSKCHNSSTMATPTTCKKNKLRRGNGGVDNMLMISGCKCSLDAVLDPLSTTTTTPTPRVVAIKRSEAADDNQTRLPLRFREDRQVLKRKMKSHDRTFEWLKQLQVSQGAATGLENIASSV